MLKAPNSTGGPNPLWCCLFETVAGPVDGLYPCSSVSHSGISSSTSITMWLPRLLVMGHMEGPASGWGSSLEGPASGWGGGSLEGPASGWGRGHVGLFTCAGGMDDFAVPSMTGGNIESLVMSGKWLLRPLTSCSRAAGEHHSFHYLWYHLLQFHSICSTVHHPFAGPPIPNLQPLALLEAIPETAHSFVKAWIMVY